MSCCGALVILEGLIAEPRPLAPAIFMFGVTPCSLIGTPTSPLELFSILAESVFASGDQHLSA